MDALQDHSKKQRSRSPGAIIAIATLAIVAFGLTLAWMVFLGWLVRTLFSFI